MDKIVGDRAAAYDRKYHMRWKLARRWTREALEARLAYAADVDKGGCLTGDEIQCALRAIDAPNLNGRKVLDYCCGTGKTAVYFALCGAEVWAFDASAEAIAAAKKSAEMTGVSQSTHFDVLDAEMLPYDNDFFDVAFCKSALHIIVDYPKCPIELCRVLKPGGRAVFCEEALGHNPFLRPIRWLRSRKWVKTGDTRLLRYPDIEQFGMPFSQTEIQHFNLLMEVKKAFKGQLSRRGYLKPWSKKLLKTLEKADRAILSALPSLKKYCGAVVVSFVK